MKRLSWIPSFAFGQTEEVTPPASRTIIIKKESFVKRMIGKSNNLTKDIGEGVLEFRKLRLQRKLRENPELADAAREVL